MSFGISAASIGSHLHFPQFCGWKKKETSALGQIASAASNTLKVVADLTSRPDSLQYCVQGIMNAASVATQGAWYRGCDRLSEVNCQIDLVRSVGDFNRFISGAAFRDLAKGYVPGFISDSMFLAASTGSWLCALSRFEMIDLPALANSVGSVSIFGVSPLSMVTKITIGDFCCLSSTVGFALGAVHCLMTVKDGDKSASRLYQMAYCISSAVAQLFCVAGQSLVAAPVAVTIAGSLGVVAAGYGALWIWQVHQEKK